MDNAINKTANILKDKAIQAEFEWGNDPENKELKKDYERKVKRYLGYCVRHGLDYEL